MGLAMSELQDWMKLNAELFKEQKWTPDEIFDMAVWGNGFDKDAVYKELSHFRDALNGTCFDNRAEFYVWHETLTIEMLYNPFSLRERWDEVMDYQNEGIEFKQ